MAADLLIVEADGGTPQVRRLGADGTLGEQVIDAGVPNTAGLLPDADGGFTWQPDWASADPVPVLHRAADGETSTLIAGGEPGAIQLVGWDRGMGHPLVTERSGSGFEGTTADPLVVPLDGGDPERVRDGVGASSASSRSRGPAWRS